jgi:hypothetical protein
MKFSEIYKLQKVYYLQIFMYHIYCVLPYPMTERSNARTVFGRSNTGIVGSTLTRGMDVCPRFSVLCFLVCR